MSYIRWQSRNRPWALILAFGAIGCGATLSNPAPGDWVEVKSRHFTVRAESDPETARETVTRLERFYSAFDQVAYPHEPKPNFSIDVVLFDNEREVEALGHDAPGLLQQRTGPDLEDRLTIITHGKLDWHSDDDEYTRFLHELAHRFTAFHFPSAPIWLNEGLSELFSTMEIEDNTVILGKYLPRRVFVHENWGVSGGNDPRVRIPISEAPSVETLRQYSVSTFYGLDKSDDPDDLERVQANLMNYTSAWNLVHLLLLGEGATRKYFLEYLQELARGTMSPEEAWLTHFGGSDPSLEGRYRALMKTTDRNIARIPFQPADTAKLSDRSLSPAEVRLLWSSVRNGNAPEQAENILADIRTAIALEPKLVSARVALVMELIEAEDLQAAARELEKARRLAPEDPAVVRAELVLAIDQKNSKAVDHWGPKLAKRARTAGAHALVADYLIKRGKPIAAIRAARAGLAVDPGSWICFVAVAAAHDARGDHQTAAQYLSMAINMLGEGDPKRPQLLKELAELEMLARRERGATTQTSDR